MSIVDSLVRRIVPGVRRTLPMNPDAFFHVCSTERRRFVLLEVADAPADNPVTVAELANLAAVEENDHVRSVEDVTEAQYKRCYVSLYQTQLVELDDHELVRWDREDGTVHPTATTRTAASILRSMLDAMDCDCRVYDRIEHVHRTAEHDDVFSLLSTVRRRHVVSLLSDVEPGGEVTLDWLANNIAEIQFGTEYTGTERKRVYVGLYQLHLPKLADFGAVTWDGRGPIVVTDRIRMLHDVLLAGESRLDGGA